MSITLGRHQLTQHVSLIYLFIYLFMLDMGKQTIRSDWTYETMLQIYSVSVQS